jgi:anthranilate phosphoribosyltransferase
MAVEEAKKPRVMGGDVKAAVKVLASGSTIEPAAARAAMMELMAGEATAAQTGAFLSLLSLDRCGPGIIHALADVMRNNATVPEIHRNGETICDIVGTGGDGQDTFNISTAAGLVAAGAGASVVKHGNRAASSKSGAADILEALGAKLETPPAEVAKVLSAGNFVFLFARSYHPAMKFVGPIRLELGIRTVFNILGPLTNPARPDAMVCGVYTPSLGPMFVEVFKMLGMKRCLVVHGLEGLDELSIAGPSKVWELCPDGSIKDYEVTPLADFGVGAHPLSAVAGNSPEENAVEMRELLSGRGRQAVREMILMNASAVMYVTGKAKTFKEGVALAQAAMSDGRAAKALDSYVAATNGK